MSYRLLAFVSGLLLGDYELWNWSLSGNHDVVALIAGVAMTPLVIAFLWLLAVNAARLLAQSSRRAPALVARLRTDGRAQLLVRVASANRLRAGLARSSAEPRLHGADPHEEPTAAAGASAARPARKLAA